MKTTDTGKKREGKRFVFLFLVMSNLWISLRPWGGGARAEAAAVTARGGALVPVQGSMGCRHGQQAWFLPASRPWPITHNISLHRFKTRLKENRSGIYLNEGGYGKGRKIRRSFCAQSMWHYVLGYFPLKSRRWGIDLSFDFFLFGRYGFPPQ